MNEGLWQAITDFDLDGPIAEYGFSTRLENENFWTVNFARGAILEYKKFMYLAAVSDFMVSPSPIVDIVWHQHLIFTQSYDEFCQILGKKIEHIPSTHHAADFTKFKDAESRTAKLYSESFGEQPADFWQHTTMVDALQLEPARFSITQACSAGAFLTLVAACGAFFLLYPLYITIGNPDFVLDYIWICGLVVIALEIYNRRRLKAIVNEWDKQAFIFNLTALELVCLQQNALRPVIHGVVNQLVLDKKIRISSDNKLVVDTEPDVNTAVEYCAVKTIQRTPYITYPDLLPKLEAKSAFNKTVRTIYAFFENFIGSKKFVNLFLLNLVVLSSLLLLALDRLLIGAQRDKPITIITFVVLISLALIAAYLWRLRTLVGTSVIPKYYKNNIEESRLLQGDRYRDYFLLGTAIYAASFASLGGVTSSNYTGNGGGSSCGSGGSSCGSGGSSCGSSCGGCGGGH